MTVVLFCVASFVLFLRVAAAEDVASCWPAVPRIVDAHVHLISLHNNISYTWGVAPSANMTCPCVFPTGVPCFCPWTYNHYRYAADSFFADSSRVKLVFVEVAAARKQWLDEARWVQRLADEDGVPVAAIVAAAPIGFGTSGADDAYVAASLDALSMLPLARGIRAANLNFSDPYAFQTIVKHTAMLAVRGLSLDVIAAVHVPSTAAAIARLAAALPRATIVLDHLGSPNVGEPSSFESWLFGMREIASHANVFVKVGGLLQYYKRLHTLPTPQQQAQFVLAALDSFGFHRAMFETNWFFVNWPEDMRVYGFWVTTLRTVLNNASAQQLELLFFRSAEAAYRLSAAV
jgi:predicted TIM-barrel fold metal-dependent hydrolase